VSEGTLAELRGANRLVRNCIGMFPEPITTRPALQISNRVRRIERGETMSDGCNRHQKQTFASATAIGTRAGVRRQQGNLREFYVSAHHSTWFAMKILPIADEASVFKQFNLAGKHYGRWGRSYQLALTSSGRVKCFHPA